MAATGAAAARANPRFCNAADRPLGSDMAPPATSACTAPDSCDAGGAYSGLRIAVADSTVSELRPRVSDT